MRYSQTALLVIDMQADYIGKTSKYNYYSIELVDKVNERIAAAIKRNEMVVYVKNAGRRGQEPYVSDFADGLLIASGYIIQKSKLSAFKNPSLFEICNGRKVFIRQRNPTVSVCHGNWFPE